MPLPRTVSAPAPPEYFQQSRDKYYFEGGMKGVNLDEITVVAEKKKSSSENQYYSGLADSQLTSKDLERFSGMSFMTALSMVSGVQVMGGQVSIRGSANSPLFLVDGFTTDRIEDISYLTTNDIAEISVFKGASAAIFGSRGGNGVIAITLKKGDDFTSRMPTPPSLVHFIPLGYQKPAQFYVPKYDVDSIRQSSVPDLRTTIYWNPNLASDSTGIVHIKFFTADKANNYSVVFEGMTNGGDICRFEGIIKREDK
jgi:TonB-dependent SusC/RagA subfamily outer membrane receptor